MDPALPPARREFVVRRASGQFEVAGPGNQGTDDGVAHVVTGELAEQVFVGGEEREVGLQPSPGLLRFPEVLMDFESRSRGDLRPDNLATVEHVIPISAGGEHTWENVVLACWHCNISRNKELPDEWAALLDAMAITDKDC